MKSVDPKLIPGLYAEEEKLYRRRHPLEFMSIEELLDGAEHGWSSSSRFKFYLELEKRVGEAKCREMTKHFTCDISW